ncbi:MAG: lipase family protein [Campylobacterota bacterium]|nr:lipase family protein [Campylobacterota bacterium]
MIKKIKYSLTGLALASTIFLLNGCNEIDNSGENIVGNNLISAEVIEDINSSMMLNIVKSTMDANATNAFGYKAVKIKYNTNGQNDEKITASGLLVIPTASDAYNAYRVSQGEDPFSISMICDNHGTIFTDAEAPSNVEVSNGMPDHSLAVSMTGYAGFAAILPDYIGYGDSNSTRKPYMMQKSAANDSIDMIKASMKYMNDNGIPYNGQLFLSGYSQGGYNTLALAKEIEKSYANDFTLKGVAPMAAPSMLKTFGDAVLQTDANMSVPAFMAFIADSYSYYSDNLTLDEMILDTKIDVFDTLFDGTNDITAVHTNLQLPLNAPTLGLFKSSFITEYMSDENHKLKQLFEENDVVNWKTNSKINLIHCTSDEVIPYTFSLGAKQSLEAYGSQNITLTPIDGNYTHSSCGATAYGAAVQWFDSIRQGD